VNEACDPETAVILLDVVLGYGAHPDPAGELVPAITRAAARARQEGRPVIFVASVTGTDDDPQRRSRQIETLENAGVIIANSNAQAARLAGIIAQALDGHAQTQPKVQAHE
jgi:FdrA protein